MLGGYALYVTSFTEDPDLLSQWRGYAGGGGYAVGFDGVEVMEALLDVQTLRGGFFKCVYDIEEQRKELGYALEYLEEVFAHSTETTHIFARHLFGYLLMAAPVFKDPTFAEENEWRLIFRVVPGLAADVRFRTSGPLIVPYVPLPLAGAHPVHIREVVVGPMTDQALAVRSAEQLLAAGHPHCVVRSSSVPFRGW